mgnify:CR=1 FL=1
MKWEDQRKSSNVVDQRGGKAKVALGGGVGTIVIIVVALLLGVDPEPLLDAQKQVSPQTSSPQSGGDPAAERPAEENRRAEFVKVVLATTEDVWSSEFKKMNKTYKEPKLVLFTESVASACGRASASVGPFYCPADQQAYIDLSFYEDLEKKLGAPGDFAQAYVIAHEIGHHVQNLLGASTLVHNKQRTLSKTEGNKWSVALELQADCYSGIWAYHTDKAKQLLEKGDLEEALNAAASIGDDTLQKRAGATVRPETFTHGSSKQRVEWFTTGFKTGNPQDCDTFKALGLQ